MRRSTWRPRIYQNPNDLTKVSLHWSNKASAYQVFIHKNGDYFPTKERFEKVRVALVGFIQNLPYAERELQVKLDIDPYTHKEKQTWTYYIAEKHAENFKKLVEMFPEDFELDYIDKPIGETFSSKFTPTEVWLEKFKEITGVDIRSLDYPTAKKQYRHAIFNLHPDRNIGRDDLSAQSSILNEVWLNLELQHFKTKEMPNQQQEVSI